MTERRSQRDTSAYSVERLLATEDYIRGVLTAPGGWTALVENIEAFVTATLRDRKAPEGTPEPIYIGLHEGISAVSTLYEDLGIDPTSRKAAEHGAALWLLGVIFVATQAASMFASTEIPDDRVESYLVSNFGPIYRAAAIAMRDAAYPDINGQHAWRKRNSSPQE